ncbi:hypothetical protein Q9L58_000854 [Maublancomyces gigas]|uniref:Hydrophobin n=1 Tax=Discina gigas TaxID=1032678 RepID=A0ABR3GVQ4_9PEZI
MQYSKIFSVVALLVAAAAAAPVCSDGPHAGAPGGVPGTPGGLPTPPGGLPGLPNHPAPAQGTDGVPAIHGVPGSHGDDGVSSTGGNQQAAMACASAEYSYGSCCDGLGNCNIGLVNGLCPTIKNVASTFMCCNIQPSNQQNTEQNGDINVAAPVNVPISCINVL